MEKVIPLVNSLREQYGVGPVCHELAVAPSTYYHHQQRLCNPERRCNRDKRDDLLKPDIQRVYEKNFSVYGARKVWR
ncbi:Transposase [Morganella morganii]